MDFLHENFVLPLLRNGWFNPYNTIVYGIFLIIGFFLVLRLLKWIKIKPDGNLMAAVLPFIVFAGATRALRDFIYKQSTLVLSDYSLFLSDISYNYGVIQEHASIYLSDLLPGPLVSCWAGMIAWFPTPGSYLITFIIALAALLVGAAWQRNGGPEYWKFMGIVGIAIMAVAIYLLPITRFVAVGFVILFFVIWSGLFLGLRQLIHSDVYLKRLRKDHRKSVKDLFSWVNTGIVTAHILDAAATFTALTFFGFYEQHVVPRTIMPMLGPVSMFILKIAVVLPVLYLIDSYAEDKDFRGLLKVVILILGLAPGIRDLLTLALI